MIASERALHEEAVLDDLLADSDAGLASGAPPSRLKPWTDTVDSDD